MADRATRQLVEQILREKTTNGELFTAFDVTQEARRRGLTQRHSVVRDLVHDFFTHSVTNIPYTRTLMTIPGAAAQAWVYHPRGTDPNNYQPTTAETARPTGTTSAPAARQLLLQELLAQGDPAFVDELRRSHDADELGAFAAKWYGDQRPAARKFLLEYLQRPMNVYRHEALVKRLFKLAEQAGDDEVMGLFLVLFDQSVRRLRKRQRRRIYRSVKTQQEAQAQMRAWQEQGAMDCNMWQAWRGYTVFAEWETESIRVPAHTTMPRPAQSGGRNPRTGARLPAPPPGDQYQLFSVVTRKYLRRRAWRYFRKLGKQHPERYVPAITVILKQYTDDDVSTSLALIDNWGLMHVLFHHSPVLTAPPPGWKVAPGRRLSELAPAPMYDHLWTTAPAALLDLSRSARCRPVRQWAVRMIRRAPARVLGGLPLDELFAMLEHEDAEVVALAAEALRAAPDREQVPVERWLNLLDAAQAETVEILCDVLAAQVRAERVSFSQAVALALRRPLPIARLGFEWLRGRQPQTDADCRSLLDLVEAEAEPLRLDMVRWARGVLATSPHFQPAWALEYLDSRHVEVRGEGWAWLHDDARLRDDVELWRRLLESPYDDIRLRLIADLEERVHHHEQALSEHVPLDAEFVRLLWASVLLNIARGSRAKPLVVRQLVRRIERQPAEAPLLLPILSVALRSVRGPEFRAGLVGVVRLVERNADLAPFIDEALPELRLTPH
ncbi:MAG: hypothetical protein ACK4RK_19770 [Gemmataceae bacterium]